MNCCTPSLVPEQSSNRGRRFVAKWAVVAAVALLPTGCDAPHADPENDGDTEAGTTSETIEPYTLCDGSDEWRLGLFMESTMFSGLQHFMEFPYGRGFLLVDGQCRFWTNTHRNEVIETGVLTPEIAARLADGLALDRSGVDAGEYARSRCADAPIYHQVTGRGVISCFCGCDNDDAPPSVRQRQASIDSILHEAEIRGEPWEGGLWLSAAADTENHDHLWPLFSFEDSDFVPWTHPRSPKEWLVAGSEVTNAPQPNALADIEMAQWVRAFRDQYWTTHSVAHTPGPRAYVPVQTAEGARFLLFASDRLPFEWPWPELRP